jgi:hypothetical protein
VPERHVHGEQPSGSSFFCRISTDESKVLPRGSRWFEIHFVQRLAGAVQEVPAMQRLTALSCMWIAVPDGLVELDAASTVPAEFEQREGVAQVCDVCVLGPRALVGADANRLLCKDSTRNPPWMRISEELPSRHLQRADFVLACAYLHLDWPGALGCCTVGAAARFGRVRRAQ